MAIKDYCPERITNPVILIMTFVVPFLIPSTSLVYYLFGMLPFLCIVLIERYNTYQVMKYMIGLSDQSLAILKSIKTE